MHSHLRLQHLQSIRIVLVKAHMLANRIRADFQLIPNMPLPPPLLQTLSQLPHSFWATFSWVPLWIHVKTCPNTPCIYLSFNDYFSSPCFGCWTTRVSSNTLILAQNVCNLDYLSENKMLQPPCNSQDFKLRMPIKCRSGDNNALKGHNYNFIKLWSGR